MKKQLLSASASPLKLCYYGYNQDVSYEKLHETVNYPTPKQNTMFKHAIALHKTYNDPKQSKDWLDLFFNQNFNTRYTKASFLIPAISSQEKIYLQTGSQFSQTKYHTIGSTYQYPTIKNSVKKNSLTSFNNVYEGPTMLTTSISINIRQRFNLRRSRVRLQITSRKH